VLSLKGKEVEQIACGGSFVVALGSNIKKPIPELKFKDTSKKVRASKSGAKYSNGTFDETQQS